MKTLSKPIDIQDKPNAKDLVVSQGGIQFDNVSFHYGENKGVINHLNLDIKPGEKSRLGWALWRWQIHVGELAVTLP